MSEPSQRPAIASSPISVILFGQALSTETAEALTAWRHYLDSLGRPCEILLLHEASPPCDDVTVRSVPYEQAQGSRIALNDAIRAAQYPLLVFSTADKQYRPADLESMLKLIDKVDLVTGFRAGGPTPFWRVLLDTLFTIFGVVVLGIPPQKRVSWLGARGWGRRWVARWLFGVGVIDPECPFRLARRALFERLPIQSGGLFVHVEVLAKANHMGCLLAEELVAWSPPPHSESAAISFGHDARLVFRDPLFA